MSVEIIPGIYELFIPIPNNPLGNTNVYFVKGDDGATLIDAGWNSDAALRSLESELKAIGSSLGEVRRLIVTHAHFDHYGLAGRIKKATSARIYLHERDEEIFRTRYAITEEAMRENEQWFRANGVPGHEVSVTRIPFGGMRAPGIPPRPDVELRGGETISNGLFDLQVVWTPGHSPGHICLYEPKHRLLFAGDHVLPVITPNISLPPNSKANPLGSFLNSLGVVRKLDVDIVLPAHENVFRDLGKRIDELMHHHEVRNGEILKTLEAGPATAYEVSRHVTWMPELGGVHFDHLMPGDQRAAMSETLAHLRNMTVTGRVSPATQDHIILYERKIT